VTKVRSEINRQWAMNGQWDMGNGQWAKNYTKPKT